MQERRPPRRQEHEQRRPRLQRLAPQRLSQRARDRQRHGAAAAGRHGGPRPIGGQPQRLGRGPPLLAPQRPVAPAHVPPPPPPPPPPALPLLPPPPPHPPP